VFNVQPLSVTSCCIVRVLRFIPPSGSDVFCHKHFVSDERESETLDETSWSMRLVFLTVTVTGRFTFRKIVNRYTNLGRTICEACEVSQRSASSMRTGVRPVTLW
jgi:hypothetical protein